METLHCTATAAARTLFNRLDSFKRKSPGTTDVLKCYSNTSFWGEVQFMNFNSHGTDMLEVATKSMNQLLSSLSVLMQFLIYWL